MRKKSKIEKYIAECAESAAARFEETVYSIIERCESPIEELLMAALYEASTTADMSIQFMNADQMPLEAYFDETAFVFTQQKFGPYRVDIAILDASLPFELAKPRIMIVECDGHDFHERTKEQAKRDKKRDRYFQSRGFKVLRFTGSEIWADPDECAEEVLSQLARDDSWRNRER